VRSRRRAEAHVWAEPSEAIADQKTRARESSPEAERIWTNEQVGGVLVSRRPARFTQGDVARAIRNDMQRAVQHDVTAAYDAYQTTRESVGLSAQALTAARESFRIQQTRYQSGATTILDLLDAEVNLSQAEADYVAARYGTRLALAGLETILGKRLFTDKEPQ